MANYIDILRRSNPGVYIKEKDYSIFNITGFFNKIFLVIGVSNTGPFNLPVMVVSPENFEDIFGKQDMKLERKGSYFHRTVKNLLKAGPVMCINLRLTDNELDKYNWVSLSTSSDNTNSKRRSNSIKDFYNLSDGFWRRSKENLLRTSLENIPNASKKPLTFVNTGTKTVSILSYKSDITGFDLTVEDWYNGNYPEHLHPKDYISDYMIQVAVVEGKWNNYEELSVDPKWSTYFDKDGIRVDKVEDFYNLREINLLKRWQCCLIPFFQDKNGTDMYIESVINADVNETGIFASYNTDTVESLYRNGIVDILGDGLTRNRKASFDFLSYKRFISDFLIIDEKLIDSAGNVFGNHTVDLGLGRTMLFSEGYTHNVKLKPIIISTTTSISVKPLDAGDDSYVIINGKRVDIDSNIEDILALHEVVRPGFHTPYLVMATNNGIEFRVGEQTPLSQKLFLPHIDAESEIVLGYYEIIQDAFGNYSTKLTGVILDENGFINPFRVGTEIESKIKFLPTEYDWITHIDFEDIFTPDPQNYQQQRLYHLWFWLSENLSEEDSLTLDINGNKKLVDWIEPNNDGTNRSLKIAVKDKNSDVYNTSGTNGNNGFYMKDTEFIPQYETKWDEKIEPFTTGDGGIIGDDSFLKESYHKGDVNSGDPFFWSFSEETDVTFIFDIQNMIIIPNGPLVSDYAGRKAIIFGSEYNDGVFTILSVVQYKGDFALIVQEEVIPEYNVNTITFFDGDDPKILNLYEIGNKVNASVEEYDGEPDELYKRLLEEKQEDAQWVKTLEIEHVIDNTKVLVKWDKYASNLEKGSFLLAKENKITDDPNELARNWTRVIDLVRYDLDDSLLIVETDMPIFFRNFEGDLQTDILLSIPDWVDTLDFKVLEPYITRSEVLPDGSEERQNKILDMVAPRTKMNKALGTDNLDWRYLVDSFGKGLTQTSKYQLASVVENKHLAFGFLNMPSVKDFRKMGDAYATDGVFDTKKLLSGGDRRNSGGVSYSLTDIGKSHVAYLTPYVAISEDSRYRLVPPSAYVGEMFMKKHNDNRLSVWDIYAGTKQGRMTTISGLETVYTNDQLNDLNQFNVTSITTFDNLLYYIHNESTASDIVSATRFIHVREALIELETKLKDELQFFQWKFFGEELTEEITSKANEVCEEFKKANAIADFYNQFVATPELQDAQIGIMNTYVEPVFGMGRIDLTVNIFGTGQISRILG